MSGDGMTSGSSESGGERLDGSAAEGKRGGKRVGVRAWGCHMARGRRGAWPRPAGGTGSSPSVARAGDVRRARVPAGNREGERRLTGGPRHSAGRRCR
jgi:hypothetical protein